MFPSIPIINATFSSEQIIIYYPQNIFKLVPQIIKSIGDDNVTIASTHDINTIIGKTIINIESINFDGYNDSDYIIYFNNDSQYIFTLVIHTNGYYSGWLDIIEMRTIVLPKIKNDIIIKILIGLPGSGKTTFMYNMGVAGQQNICVCDDVLYHQYIFRNMINKLYCDQYGCIIITDPRLCDAHYFSTFMENNIINIIPSENIDLILFKNDVDGCLKNIQIREKDNISKYDDLVKFIECYKDIYKSDHPIYVAYNSIIVDVYNATNEDD